MPTIPHAAREPLTHAEITADTLKAMTTFLSEGDEGAFERAVALYVTSARSRKEPIESVLGVCCALATDLEGPRVVMGRASHDTKMHSLIFAGILRAFYGDVAVDRGIGASEQRRADAPQHLLSGTWPRRPTD